jgi:hypothetical protein
MISNNIIFTINLLYHCNNINSRLGDQNEIYQLKLSETNKLLELSNSGVMF